MRRRRGIAVLCSRRAGLACVAPRGLRHARTASRAFAASPSPDAEVAYRWEPAELKVGQFFAAEVVACRTPGQSRCASITIDATMPAHGHGMNYRPDGHATAPGHYRFTGLMLHMPGTLAGHDRSATRAAGASRLTHEVILRP